MGSKPNSKDQIWFAVWALYQSAKWLTFTDPSKSYKRSPGSSPGAHAANENFPYISTYCHSGSRV